MIAIRPRRQSERVGLRVLDQPDEEHVTGGGLNFPVVHIRYFRIQSVVST
jgi:hypothetical protein